MQTTLLGLAIALILALLAALVGPLFADWDRYRNTFEAEASRLVGMPVRVRGAIDARILPTPSVTLRRVDIGKPGEDKPFKVRSLRIEFALGALVRGELSASKMDLNGPELVIGLDRGGQIDWPVPVARIKPDALSIQRLNIEDGSAILKDQASGTTLVLSRLWFNGDLRSLAGPFKGEGAFVLDGKLFPYRVSAGRLERDGMKLRLFVDPVEDRQLSAEADGTVSFVRGAPHFDGALSLGRPAGVEGRGPAQLNQPWRAVAKVAADPARAIVEQIAFQYGPDERALRLRGDARVIFGRLPRVEGVLSARQIDLDRWLHLSDADRRNPLAAARALTELLRSVRNLPIAMRFGVSVDTVTLAGAALQRVSADVRTDAQFWDIETLEFRAPGLTRVALSGRLNATPKGPSFAGPIRVESGDGRALLTWLTDRHGDPAAFASGSLNVAGDVALAGDRIAIERFKGEFNDVAVDGRLVYAWAAGDKPARIDAVLRAPALDLDRLAAFSQAMFKDAAFDRPGEGSLALEVGKATLAGVTAENAVARVQFDGSSIAVDRLAVGDFGGASFALNGRVDLAGTAPRGIMTLDLDARTLDGVNALAARFAPDAANTLRGLTPRLQPAKLRTTLTLTGAGESGTATLGIEGNAGAISANIVAGLSLPRGKTDKTDKAGKAGLTFTDVTTWPLQFDGRLETGDGAVLLALLGLDRYVATDAKPARATVSANGALDGDLRIDARITAATLAADLSGGVRLLAQGGPHAALKLNLKTSGLHLIRTRPPTANAKPVAADLRADVVADGKSVRLDAVSGTFGGSTVRGRIGLTETTPATLDGDLTIGEADVPALLAAAIGMPRQGPAPARRGRARVPSAVPPAWSPEPFATAVEPELRGRVALTFERAELLPGLVASDVQAVLRMAPSELAIEEINGGLAGGRMKGQIVFDRGAGGLSARGSLSIVGAKADVVSGELFAGNAKPAVSGLLDIHVTAAGAGRSPLALIGAMNGSGTFSLTDGAVASLDPDTFATVMGAVDKGLALDTERINQSVARALQSEPLAVKQADGAVTISAGRLQLGRIIVRGERVDLAMSGAADLNRMELDAELVLTGPPDAEADATGRPAIAVSLAGPLAAPKRTINAAAFSAWLGTRAINQQAKRIEELERKRKALQSEDAAGDKPPAADKPSGSRTETAPANQPSAQPDDAAVPARATPARASPADARVTPAAATPETDAAPTPAATPATPPSAVVPPTVAPTTVAPAAAALTTPAAAPTVAAPPAGPPAAEAARAKTPAEPRQSDPEEKKRPAEAGPGHGDPAKAAAAPAEKPRRTTPSRTETRRAPSLPPPINIVPRSAGRATARQSERAPNGYPPPPVRNQSPFDFLLRP